MFSSGTDIALCFLPTLDPFCIIISVMIAIHYPVAVTRYVNSWLSSERLAKSSREIFVPTDTIISEKKLEIHYQLSIVTTAAFLKGKNGETCRTECRSQTQGM
jgi:hypothetical protein